jgi:hypothetical protein
MRFFHSEIFQTINSTPAYIQKNRKSGGVGSNATYTTLLNTKTLPEAGEILQ